MDAIADVLQPYKELVGTIAGVVTVAQMGSGGFICWDIYKQGSTKGIGIAPFLCGLIMSVLTLKFGFILDDNAMIQVNSFGLALNLVYVLIFFKYAEQKLKTWMHFGVAAAISAALIVYADYEDPKLVQNRFGIIITVFVFCLITAPLLGLKNIIKNKSSEGIPFPMVFGGAMVTFMWLLYGVIIRNKFLVLQNTVAFVLLGFQLFLCVIYPVKRKGKRGDEDHSQESRLKGKSKKADYEGENQTTSSCKL